MVKSLPDDWDDNPDWTAVETRPLDPSGMLLMARAKLGLTQDAAGELLGISVVTLRDWEERRAQPDEAGRTLIRLLFQHPHEVLSLLKQDSLSTASESTPLPVRA